MKTNNMSNVNMILQWENDIKYDEYTKTKVWWIYNRKAKPKYYISKTIIWSIENHANAIQPWKPTKREKKVDML